MSLTPTTSPNHHTNANTNSTTHGSRRGSGSTKDPAASILSSGPVLETMVTSEGKLVTAAVHPDQQQQMQHQQEQHRWRRTMSREEQQPRGGSARCRECGGVVDPASGTAVGDVDTDDEDEEDGDEEEEEEAGENGNRPTTRYRKKKKNGVMDKGSVKSGTHRRRSSSRRSPQNGQPYQQQHQRLLLRKNAFHPRPSPLDWDNLSATHNPMMGFFTLFWITMSIYMVSVLYQNYVTRGILVGHGLFWVMFHRSLPLILSELALILSLFVNVPLAKLLVNGYVPARLLVPFQHTYQTVWFAFCIGWVLSQTWSWTQSGFFTIHVIAMLMKQHSYMASVVECVQKRKRLGKCMQRMDEVAAELKRLEDQPRTPLDTNEQTTPTTTTTPTTSTTTRREHQLEIEWQTLKETALTLRSSLTKGATSFPSNVTFANFVDYLLVPTLVYELEYPRTSEIRWAFVAEKALGTIGVMMILYVTIEHYVYPVLNELGRLSFLESTVKLMLPFTLCYMLIFFVIFEFICNFFAELTRFADREFYEDWWNALTFDEYARKWNKPVHEFLLRHVYLESITTYKLTKRSASFVTFFLSSCLHELVMSVLARRVRMYLFFMQMTQLPLILLARWSRVRKRPRVGNALFWLGLCLGPPLLAVGYCREHFLN
ncbi:MBOAT, membrane-bound O-acyltransferase family-domain-containing protein [Gaertneriomyces semiglobifer]|nr:MBOAT, membrane-bound O-acyltransferase family-domain-containing protein [Gaertneriomyces semiglobifer]